VANISITNLDIGGVILQNAEFRDELLKFADADVAAAGTILARQEVATAITVAAGSNTGDGTVTLATVAGAEVPIAGAWNLEFTAALVVKLEDPNGRIIASNVAIADGGAIVLNIAGMQFTVTDGTTAFVSGDTFSLTVVADGDLCSLQLLTVLRLLFPVTPFLLRWLLTEILFILPLTVWRAHRRLWLFLLTMLRQRQPLIFRSEPV